MNLNRTFVFYFSLGALASFSLITGPLRTSALEPNENATCKGAYPCLACSNCKSCKYCKGGGKCGACDHKEQPSERAKAKTTSGAASTAKASKPEPERNKLVASEDVNLKTWATVDGKTKVKGSFVRLEKGKVHLVKEDGKRSIISLATLTDSDKVLAEKFEALAVNAKKKYGDVDRDRRTWDNVSYKTTIAYSDDRLWTQKEKENAEMVSMIYVSHTSEFIELYHPQKQHHLKLFNDHMEANKNGRWEKIGDGGWIQSPRAGQ